MANYNKNQLKVIQSEGGSLVVSASAGSGKTTVMIERLIRLIAGGKCDVKDILCVTFTKKAAGEMRDKLSRAIIEKIKRGEDVERMRKQLSDLPLAAISTVDSFLHSLVSKYFYLAGVDSKFSIVDEADSAVMKASSLSEVFERLYEANDPDMLALLRTFVKRRSDEGLKGVILSIYTFMDNEINGYDYLERSLHNYTEEGLKEVEKRLIARLLIDIDKYREMIFDLYLQSRSLGVKKYEDYYLEYYNLFDIIKNDQSENAVSTFLDWKKSRPRVSGGGAVDALKEQAEAVAKRLAEWKKTLKKPFEPTFDERLEMTKASGKIIQSLIKVIKLFDEEYSRQKADKNLLDYADLSKKAYELLSLPDVREELKKTYKYIFVDEYQDTNAVQEGIFRLLENQNLFIVGDVKQSIYGFRGCNSDIFANRMREGEEGGFHVALNENYRSSEAVIEGVNSVFSRVMTKAVSGTDYAASPMIYGDLYGGYEGECALYAPEKSSAQAGVIEGVYSVEKHLSLQEGAVATEERLIHYLVNKSLNKSVFDLKTKKTRPANYGDIAILVRTNPRGDKIAKELSLGGIPVVTDSGRSLFDYPEIKQVVNLLEFIYCGDNDVALAAALKSPVGCFTDEELVAVRRFAPKKTFVEAAFVGASDGGEIGLRLKEFFDYIGELKTVSKIKGVPTILRKVIKDKSYDVKILAGRGGGLKLKRIEGFISQCNRGGKEITLGEFIKNKESLLEKMSLSIGGEENAVRVVSMHSSKGLEWPIVIVAGLSGDWNRNDSRSEIIVDRDCGLGLKFYDALKRVRRDTTVHQYVKMSKEDANLRDEMRLMYVAMTRAKSILYIVSKNPLKEESKEGNFRGHVDFLRTGDMPYFEVDGESLKDLAKTDGRRKVILPPVPDKEGDLYKDVAKHVGFVYPYEKDTRLSIKRTVTDISGAFKERLSDEPSYKPIFGDSFVLKGNAYHRVLELADFDKIGDNGYIEALLKEKLTEEEQSAVTLDRVKDILSSPIFEKLKGYKLYKEHPFIVTVPPEMAGESGDEEVLVQGVIDLLAIKGDNAVIVDYKHSHKGREALKATYKKQLELYSYAVEKATGKRVEGLIIFNILSLEEIVL